MRKVIGLSLLAGISLTGALLVYSGEAQMDGYRITGAFTHENLSVFLIHGDDAEIVENMRTLKEALENESIIIHETGNVEELMIENKSDYPVFIHSGDIVKGGRQDRILRYDMVLGPKSGKMPLSAFCVEQGRWSRRGDEEMANFGSVNYMVAGKDIKLASKVSESQVEVWSEVIKMQEGLSDAVGVSARSGRSRTSLQLTFEHDSVDSLSGQYIDAITAEVNLHEDVVGFAFTINGQINSADIYRSNGMFRKLWPRLIKAAAIEAVSKLQDNGDMAEITIPDIISWLEDADDADDADASELKANDFTRLLIKEKEFDVVFETIDTKDGSMIHKNVIRRY